MMIMLPLALVLVLAFWIALPVLIWPAAREARLAAVPLASALVGVVTVAVAAGLLHFGVAPLSGGGPPVDPLPSQHIWQSLLVAGFAQLGLGGFGLIATGGGWRRLAISGSSAAHLGIGVLISTRMLPALLPGQHYSDYDEVGQWLEPLTLGGLVLLGAGLLAMVLAVLFRLIAALTRG